MYRKGGMKMYYELHGNMLKTGETAFLFKVHPNTVRRWSDQKRIEAYRDDRNCRKFSREQIIKSIMKKTFDED
jgi:DNA-binding transcriptional MerR regulator